MEETLLTPEQVARRLQVTPRTIYDWLRNGRLRGVKLGRLWRVRSEELEALLDGTNPKQKDRDEVISLETHVPEGKSWDPQAPTPEEQRAEQARKNEGARRLLQEWMADETGYDEEVWPLVKQLIEENRMSNRKRFADD